MTGIQDQLTFQSGWRVPSVHRTAAKRGPQGTQPPKWHRKSLARRREPDRVHVAAGGNPPRPGGTDRPAGDGIIWTPAFSGGQYTPEHESSAYKSEYIVGKVKDKASLPLRDTSTTEKLKKNAKSIINQ
jgi:hypothetical protein